MKLLNKVAKIVLLVGGVAWGLFGLTALLGMAPFNVVSWLMGLIGASKFASWVYVLVGASAVLLGATCMKEKDY